MFARTHEVEELATSAWPTLTLPPPCPCVLCRRGLPAGAAGEGGGEAVWGGAAAERGEEHPEERRDAPHGPAAPAAGPDAGRQEAQVRGHPGHRNTEEP